MSPQTVDVPVGGEVKVAEARKVLALRRDQVPSAPRGTTIVAAEYNGGPSKSWKVDGIDRADEPDVIRVVLMPVS